MWQSISSADNLSLLPTICLWCRLYICYADNLSVMPTIHVLRYYLWCWQYICYAGNLSLMPTIHVLIRQSSFYAVTLIPCLYIWLPVCVYVWYMYKYPIQQEVWHELVGWDLPSSIPMMRVPTRGWWVQTDDLRDYTLQTDDLRDYTLQNSACYVV